MTVNEVELKVGDNAPDFCLPDKDNKKVCLNDFKGSTSSSTFILKIIHLVVPLKQ